MIEQKGLVRREGHFQCLMLVADCGVDSSGSNVIQQPPTTAASLPTTTTPNDNCIASHYYLTQIQD